METIKFDYKGYTVSIVPLEKAESNYNMFLHITKGGNVIYGTSMKGNTPFNEIITEVEQVIE